MSLDITIYPEVRCICGELLHWYENKVAWTNTPKMVVSPCPKCNTSFSEKFAIETLRLINDASKHIDDPVFVNDFETLFEAFVALVARYDSLLADKMQDAHNSDGDKTHNYNEYCECKHTRANHWGNEELCLFPGCECKEFSTQVKHE